MINSAGDKYIMHYSFKLFFGCLCMGDVSMSDTGPESLGFYINDVAHLALSFLIRAGCGGLKEFLNLLDASFLILVKYTRK